MISRINTGIIASSNLPPTGGNNNLPIANAGIDQSITLPVSTVTLTGSGTDTDGTITTYAWTKISGPAGCAIISPTLATTKVVDLTVGTYVFQLAVTDNLGGVGTDTVQITVATVSGRIFYVAPTTATPAGLDTRTVAQAQNINTPWATIEKACSVMVAGDLVYLRGGTYNSLAGNAASALFRIQGLTGTASLPITISAYPGEVPIFDCINITTTYSDPYALYFQGNTYVNVKGHIILKNFKQIADGSGISRGWVTANCNNCRIEFVEVYNMGGTGFSLSQSNNNTIINCDFHHNGDGLTVQAGNVPDPWNATDGFSCTGGDTSTGNTFDACRMYINSDDGCDFFDWNGNLVTVQNCWSFWNSIKPWGPSALSFTSEAGMTPTDPTLFVGNTPSHNAYKTSLTSGEGFKAGGGSQTGHTTTLTKRYYNNLAFENVGSGYPGNALAANSGQYQYYNCVAYANGKDGFQYASGWATGIAHWFKNCWAWNNYRYSTLGVDVDWSYDGLSTNISNNYWDSIYNGINYGNLKATIGQLTSADFLSVSSVGMDAPRKVDGSLPDTNFLKLAPTSRLLNRGVDVGLPYLGSAPDLGCFEYVPATNLAPTANAGVDATIVLPINSVTLTGSGSDSDGTISAYAWTQVSGPNTATFTAASSATTNATGLIAGTYVFKLTVTDNNGATGIDTVQVIVAPQATGRVFYISNGTYGAAGSDARSFAQAQNIATPWATWDRVNNFAGQFLPGDTIYIRGGVYNSLKGGGSNVPHVYFNGLNGASGNMLKIWAYPGDAVKPTMDLSTLGVPTYPDPNGMYIANCSYLHVKGFRITGLKQIQDGSGISRGFGLDTSPNCLIEQIEIDHIGGSAFNTYDNSNNAYYLNCDAHHNDDRYSGGSAGAWGGADGFDCTGNVNTTNITYDGCRAWLNSDDGWDNFNTDGTRTWKNCWAFWNGYYQDAGMPNKAPAGDGNGFKLGPARSSVSTADRLTILRFLNNCLSFENRYNGFDQNGTPTMLYQLYNCTAYNNGSAALGGYGFQFQYWSSGTTNPLPQTLKNNIALGNNQGPYNFTGPTTNIAKNSWNGFSITNSDFLSVSSVGMDGARQSDGSLPVLNFLRLSPSSSMVNAGVNVGLPFNGSAPDLGAYET
jgi:hypothetical protein